MKPLNIAIGYDPREAVTWHVLAQSILARSSGPVNILPLALSNLKGVFTRQRDPVQSTDFAYSRFLTPYLFGYEDCLFMDSDMLVLCDIWELAEIAKSQPYSDVLCVKHDYTSKVQTKFLGAKQTQYPMKNWSSLMWFNGHRQAVRRLTPDYVAKATGMELHQFKWAVDVGEIPREYNWLVDEYEHNVNAKIVHYTLGSPCFRAYQNCGYSMEWFEELGRTTHCDDPILEIRDAYLHRRGGGRSERLPQPDGLHNSGEERDQHDDPPLQP